VLLHYRRLEEIDWLAVGETSEITLLIAPVVIRELDKHKDRHPLQKLRNRAREVLADLHAKFTKSHPFAVRPGVKVQFIADEPQVDFKAHRLHADVSDDWLIASMLEWRERHPDHLIVLVTADSGLEFKAPTHDIPTIRPPDEARLSDEVDAQDKRIKQLERENAELKITLPDLKLTFGDGNAVLKVLIAAESTETNIDVQAELARIRSTYPHVEDHGALTRETRRMTLGQLAAAMKGGATIDLKRLAGPEEYKRYNQEVETFYQQYEDYLALLIQYEEKKSRRIEFDLKLHNGGGGPADDIDIHMHFPDGFALMEADDEPAAPEAPEPPREIGYVRPIGDVLRYPYFDLAEPKILGPPPNVSSPDITLTESYDVRQHVRKLKHGYSCPIGRYVVIFDSIEAFGSFGIDYTISADNLPKVATGRISVVIVAESDSQQ
jgi:hypothetical protein